jgi:hypothetical protein
MISTLTPVIAENAGFIPAGFYLSLHLPVPTAWSVSMAIVAAHIVGTFWPIIRATVRRRKPTFQSFSWSDGSIGASIATLLISALFPRALAIHVLFSGGLALTLCYAVMKTRCFINRCCEVDRRQGFAVKFLRDVVPLHVFESVSSLSFAAVGLRLAPTNVAIASSLLWLSHLALRLVNRHMRQTSQRSNGFFEAAHAALAALGVYSLCFV